MSIKSIKGIGVLSIALTALIALSGCSVGAQSPSPSASSTNSKLVVAETVPPQTFDPTQSSQIATMYAWQLVYSGLVQIDSKGTVQPDLATSWTISPDRMTYGFTLRKGAKFSDGSPLTADDVVFSFNRLLTKGLPYSQTRFASLKSVAKIDATHVSFTLKTPDAGFLLNLGSPFLIGSAILSEAWSKTHDPKTDVLGTGPFKVASYAPNSELVLVRNDNYWDKANMPKYKELDIKYMPDQAAQVAALLSGQIDLMFPSSENVIQLQKSKSVSIKSVPGTNTIRLNINTNRAPFNNQNVREAISLALNRPNIVKGAFFGQAVPSAQMPPTTAWAVPLNQLDNQTSNVKQAKALLAKAGYPNGFSLTLDHLAGYATYLDRFSSLVKSELAAVDIKVTIQADQNPVWLANQNSANYDLMDNVYSFTGDPMSLLSPRPGRQGPTPTALTDLMQQAITGAPSEYGANLKKILAYEDKTVFPDIAVAAPKATIAYGKRVASVTPTSTLARQFLVPATLK